MNVNLYNTTVYENKCNWTLGENKPNSKPIKANQSQDFIWRKKLHWRENF
jgi:hypothetical protein